jgi:hypothetical protein
VCTVLGEAPVGLEMARATRQRGWPRRGLESMATGHFGLTFGPAARG